MLNSCPRLKVFTLKLIKFLTLSFLKFGNVLEYPLFTFSNSLQGHRNVFEHSVDKPSCLKLSVDKIQK